MKRTALAVALVLLAGNAWAQGIEYKPSGTAGATGATGATGPTGPTGASDLTDSNTLGTAYGADMVTNGTFTGNATGWTLGGAGGAPDWAYASNNVTHGNGGGTATLEPSTPLTVVAGRTYRVTFTLSSLTAGTVTASIGGASATAAAVNGTYVHTLVAVDTTNLKFTPTTTLVATIDTISVEESKSTTVANLTSGRIPFATTGGRLTDSASFLADDSGGGNGIFTVRKTPSGGSATSNFLNVTGTIPATLGATFVGHYLLLTGAGSGSSNIYAFDSQLSAGYTGSGATRAITALNNSAATGAWSLAFTSAAGNAGVYSTMSSTTTGSNFGLVGIGSGGDYSVGVFGSAAVAKNSGVNIGVIGISNNSGTTPVRVGGWFTLGSSLPTFVDTALGVDNGAVAAPIFSEYDNGTLVAQTIDGGAKWAKVGTKTLTESSATLFVRVDVASSGRQGGIIEYCVDADDSTDFQERCGSVSFSGVNKAGTETCGVGTPADAVAVSTGTLTVSFDTENAGTNQCGIRANAASSLTQTTLRINYHVREFGNAATAATAQ